MTEILYCVEKSKQDWCGIGVVKKCNTRGNITRYLQNDKKHSVISWCQITIYTVNQAIRLPWKYCNLVAERIIAQ